MIRLVESSFGPSSLAGSKSQNLVPDSTSLSHPYFAVGLFGEAVHLAKAKTGAFADVLCREKRLEDTIDLISLDAVASVCDFHGHELICGFNFLPIRNLSSPPL